MFKTMMPLVAMASLALSAGADADDRTVLVFDAEGRPSARVTINEQAEFLFAVDTAAQRTGLGAPIIEQLALEPDPEMVARMHGVSGVVTVPMYQLASIEMGARRLEGEHVLSLTGGHDQGAHAHAGILGQDVFAGSQLVMDFEAMELGFDISAEVLATSLDAELMLGSFVVVDIEVGGVATRALIDTGAARSFANSRLLHELAMPGAELTQTTERRGVSQQEIAVIQGLVPAYRIGDVAVPATPLDSINSPVFATFGLSDQPAIVLGMDVLGQLPGFAIDYQSARFHITSNG